MAPAHMLRMVIHLPRLTRDLARLFQRAYGPAEMMKTEEGTDMGAFEVIVLGGGTAGVQVAAEVARGGRSVALIEAGLIGGESPYLACLPSNSLLLSASRGESWEDAVARRNEVTGGLDDSAPARRLRRAGVTVIRGTGRITAPGT